MCAIRPATTRDHVPPKGLFKGLAVPLITVPACRECNNGSSSDDEDVRFFISVQIGKQTSGSAKLWNEGAHKSIKTKSALRDSIQASIREIEDLDSEGNCVTRLAFDVPISAYQAVFERTTRGLYFFHTRQILPPSTPIEVQILAGQIDLEADAAMALTKRSIGDDACVYRFGIDSVGISNSVWLYEFYNAHWVMVRTGAVAEGSS